MTDKAIQLKDASDNNLFPVADYNNSINRPSINGIQLTGNKTSAELGFNTRKTLLWTNPNPSSNFNGQSITLSETSENFDMLIFVSKYGTGDTRRHSDIAMIGESNYTITTYQESTTNTSSDTTMAWRNVTISGTTVTINNAMYNAASAGGYNRNNICIPLYIYGIKF